jgi:hypothetical protein
VRARQDLPGKGCSGTTLANLSRTLWGVWLNADSIDGDDPQSPAGTYKQWEARAQGRPNRRRTRGPSSTTGALDGDARRAP